jgi:hypothetical protein
MEIDGKASYPSNTIEERGLGKTKVKTEASSTSRVKKAITTTAKKRKKSFGKQFTELFVGADGGSMSTYLLQDIVIPTAKGIIRDVTEAITDGIKRGIEMQLFGSHSSQHSRDDRDRPNRHNTAYDRVTPSRTTRVNSRTHDRNQSRNRNFDEVVVDSHGEARDIIAEMKYLIDEYGQVTVKDLNELISKTGEFTDDYHGWYNLSSARVTQVRDGYLVDLPRPAYLQ